MAKKIARYLASTILWSSIGVLGVLVGLDLLSALVDEAQDLSATYRFSDVLSYLLLTTPSRVYEFIPYATLIGALVGLGRLATTSELTVVRSAGVSLGHIAWVALQPAALLAAGGFLIGEYVAPGSEQLAVSERAIARRGEAMVAGRYGTWNRDGDTFIHADAVQRGGVMFGVTLLVYEPDSQVLARTLRAERGTFQGNSWLLENTLETTFNGQGTATQRYVTYRWETDITPDLLVLEVVDAATLPTRQLWPYARYLEGQGMMFADIELAFWRKVFQPLAIGGLVLVAMSFIFGPLREGSMGGRIFSGVIVGVLFRISQDFFGPMSLLFGLAPVLAAIAPIAVCWLAGGYLLRQRL
jgi:lipopolysaccharide export system permease protein